ncbi:MAG: hypothetical protein IT512_10980 [Rhodocyclaceae bacterium]|nr:hypothetical protein [Rhodocyclaceae bacterium]
MESLALRYVRGKIGPDEYWAEMLASLSFAEACAGCPGREARLREALTDGFRALDTLDRSEPFWANTNGLATFTKLRNFAAWRIAHGDTPVEAAWLQLAASLCRSEQHGIYPCEFLEPSIWTILHKAGVLDIELLVRSACNLSVYPLDLHIPGVVRVVRDLQLRDRVLPLLDRLAGENEENREWAGEVRARLVSA